MKSLFSTSAKLLLLPMLASAVLLGGCGDKKADTASAEKTAAEANADASAVSQSTDANGHEQHDQVAVATDDVAVAEANDSQSADGVAVAEQ